MFLFENSSLTGEIAVKYLVTGMGKNGVERRMGRFRAKTNQLAEDIFWKNYAAGFPWPGYDLVLYRITFWGKRIFVAADY